MDGVTIWTDRGPQEGPELVCPVCGQGLGLWDEVYAARGMDVVAGCSRCLGLGQVEADQRLTAGWGGEALFEGAWYAYRRGTGEPLGSEGAFNSWRAGDFWDM